GTVTLAAERNGAGIKIVIENPFELDATVKNGAGLGLKNVRMRLANLYDGNARVDVNQNGGLFRVELQLPCDHSRMQARQGAASSNDKVESSNVEGRGVGRRLVREIPGAIG